MFSKKKMVGGIYKKVTDWEAVFGTVFVGFVVLVILGSVAG
jgi:hypothetical protein